MVLTGNLQLSLRYEYVQKVRREDRMDTGEQG